MKELKILVSAYACNPDSSLQLHPGEDFTGWKLVEQLSRFHNVWVITHSYNRQGVDNALEERRVQGVKFYFIHLPLWLKFFYKVGFGQRIYYYIWQIKALRVARQLHCKFHFDLAHHITFGNDWIPTFIGAYLSVPFIWGPLGGGQRTPRGLMREYSLYGQAAEGTRNAAQWLGRHDYFRRQCLKQARAILVCNKETQAKISNKYEPKIHLFPVNGVSLEDMNSNSNAKKGSKTFRVLTAGRFHRLKGFALAIRSFGIFSRKFPDSEFIIVGKGPEEHRLKRLVKRLGLESKVFHYPWLRRQELLQEMHSSDVVLFPSFRDGGGAVVVEAMACGKPIVCLDTGGPGFHIQKEWGIKIAPKNPEHVVQEMAKALACLYENKDLRRKMGEAAQQRAKEFYLWDKLGERLQKIYEQALPIEDTDPDNRIE